jgi:hypothetical protein
MKVNLNVIPYVIIAVLVGILVLQRTCNKPVDKPCPPVVVTDTVNQVIHDTVITIKPDVVYTKKDTVWITLIQYEADTNYAKLKQQYEDLGNKYFSLNVYQNKLSLGKYGAVTIKDSVSNNMLIGSQIASSGLVIPTEVQIVQQPYQPVRQLFLGGGFTGTYRSPVNGISVGALYKDLKDRVVGVNVGWNGQMTLSASYYWKVKF